MDKFSISSFYSSIYCQNCDDIHPAFIATTGTVLVHIKSQYPNMTFVDILKI